MRNVARSLDGWRHSVRLGADDCWSGRRSNKVCTVCANCLTAWSRFSRNTITHSGWDKPSPDRSQETVLRRSDEQHGRRCKQSDDQQYKSRCERRVFLDVSVNRHARVLFAERLQIRFVVEIVRRPHERFSERTASTDRFALEALGFRVLRAVDRPTVLAERIRRAGSLIATVDTPGR